MTLEQHEFESVDYNWSLEQYTAKQAIKTYSEPILSGDDKTMSENIWVELYDPKEGRKLREIPLQSKCPECDQLGGHRLDCSSATKEQLYRIAKTAQDAEAQARKRADRYWQMLQQYQGKLSTLKHENNKLRKANERFIAAMKAGEITIEKCNDCGCDVATWNSSSAVLCWDCCMCEEDE